MPAGDYLIPLCKGAIKRAGEKMTVAAIGAMVPKVLKAAERLAADGISVESGHSAQTPVSSTKI